MGTHAWITLAVVAAMAVLLVRERLPPAPTMLGALIVLFLAGVVDERTALSGFSNPAPIVVASLYVLAGAVQHTGALGSLTHAAFGPGGRHRTELLRTMAPAAAISAFVANTPVVAVLAPLVMDWSRRARRPASRYLIAVNFAVVLGGSITLFGSSLNLVVSGLLQQAGQRPLRLFETTPLGLAVTAAGLAVMVLVGPLVLPERRSPHEELREHAREFTVEMVVAPGSALAGRSVEEAGLRHLEGVFLVEIERDGERVAPVSPSERLRERDRLTFAGNVARILDLQRTPGLVSAERPHFALEGRDQRFFEAVVGTDSPLVGQTLRDVGFRGLYGAAVVAIHRAGARIPSKLGQVPLHAGDVLLLLADAGFRERWTDRADFSVISPLFAARPPARTSGAPVVGLVALGLIVLAGTGVVSVLQAALGAALALIVLRVISLEEARRSVNLDVVVLVATSFGLGGAITQSGLAATLARGLVSALAVFGSAGALAGVLLATVAVTQLVTNDAAAALIFPIAMATAAHTGLNPRAFAMATLVGASFSFLTPIGYQTNLMVYGLGGYRFGDFARLGAPLMAAASAVSLAVIPLVWPLR